MLHGCEKMSTAAAFAIATLFRGNISPPSSGTNVKIVCCSATLVDQAARDNPLLQTQREVAHTFCLQVSYGCVLMFAACRFRKTPKRTSEERICTVKGRVCRKTQNAACFARTVS